MTRLLSCVLALVVLLNGVAGCSSNNPTKTQTGPKTFDPGTKKGPKGVTIN